VPVDERIYDKAGDALTKNDHFRAMLEVAHGRGFMPESVVFARAQRNHIGLALRAFLRRERHCHHAGISWFEAKTTIIRSAVQAYLINPLYILPATA